MPALRGALEGATERRAGSGGGAAVLKPRAEGAGLLLCYSGPSARGCRQPGPPEPSCSVSVPAISAGGSAPGRPRTSHSRTLTGHRSLSLFWKSPPSPHPRL